jgi:hypothetical protein
MALPDYIQLAPAPAEATTLLDGVSIQTTANYLTPAVDNSDETNGRRDVADIEVQYAFGTAPAANTTLQVYILYAFDGANYEPGAGNGTGTGDVDPHAKSLVASLPVAAVTTQQGPYLIEDVPLLPYPFKLLVMNNATGQTATVTLKIKTRREAAIVDT